jgi:AraC-like DNA-binding protein
MNKRLQNISISFSGQSSSHTDDFSIYHFSGNHWDDIFYFPKNYQIGLIHEGKGTFTIGQKEYPLQQNDTYFIRPELVHKGKPDSQIGWAVSVLNFKAQLIEELEEQGAQLSIFKHFQAAKPLGEAVRKLLSYFDDAVTQEEAKNLVYNFLVEHSDNDTPIHNSAKNQDAIQRARRYIDANYKSKFSLDDLANEAFLSKFHLLRLFKQEVGIAPYAYQLQLKLNEARKLIFQKKSLTEVAYELGFNDQAHFIHTYKKYAELTPGEFLKTAIFYNSEEE